MSALTPDAVAALPGATASAVAWRARNQLYLTVIAKATFAFVPGGAMARTAPQEILRAEVHHGNNPVRSVRATADTVPYLGRADVLFTGHAHAPPSGLARTLIVRLALASEARCLLDKRLLVQDARGFQRMPIVYERAVAGALGLENPLGVETPEEANVLDPEVPLRPAGLGPIARAWPARKRLLGSTPRKALEAPIAEIPEGFEWAYFQAAPPDQRIDHLRGDEWLLLEGLHPTLPRMQTRLPRARARAWIGGLAGAWGRGEPIELNADTLRIDGDEHRCTVVWRRVVPVTSEAQLAAARIVAGVEVEGEPLAPPETARIVAVEPPRTPREVRLGSAGTIVIAAPPEAPATIIALHDEADSAVLRRALPFGTLALSPEAETSAAARPSLPFPAGTPAPIEAHAPAAASIPGAPWSGEAAPPAPAPSPGRATLTLQDSPAAASLDAPRPPEELGAVSARAAGDFSAIAAGDFSTDAAFAGSRDTGHPSASRFYPDLRSARGIDEQSPGALPPLNDGEEVTLERCAIVAVDLVERRAPRAEVLKAHGLDEERFRKAEQRWNEAMAQEAKGGAHALRDRYDAASVRAWEAHRGPLQIEEYARLKLAAEQRRLAAALAEASIRRSLWARITRTFDQRLAGDPHLESRFKREVARLRAAAPGRAGPSTGAGREGRGAESGRPRSMRTTSVRT